MNRDGITGGVYIVICAVDKYKALCRVPGSAAAAAAGPQPLLFHSSLPGYFEAESANLGYTYLHGVIHGVAKRKY